MARQVAVTALIVDEPTSSLDVVWADESSDC